MNKDTIYGIIFSTLMSVLLFVAFLWATAPEQWYAGSHIESCDGSANCGCKEKLIAMEKEGMGK